MGNYSIASGNHPGAMEKYSRAPEITQEHWKRTQTLQKIIQEHWKRIQEFQKSSKSIRKLLKSLGKVLKRTRKHSRALEIIWEHSSITIVNNFHRFLSQLFLIFISLSNFPFWLFFILQIIINPYIYADFLQTAFIPL
ncbi:hypothetical protein DMA11_19545 [Marinilabiliaceae bacterium JC017]|nr:hypothetical protein DMA11_19545 [Marinilabiliaceae bacterium JC017]